MSLNTTPSTWVAANVLTAAQMNLQVRDALTGIQAAWPTSWAGTPTSNITVGNGTLSTRFNRMGKTIDFSIVFTLGSTSAVSGAPTFTLPVTALTFNWVSADCTAFDTSATAWYPWAAIATSATVVTGRPWPGTAGNNFGIVSSTVPFTWGTGDVLSMSGRYEAA